MIRHALEFLLLICFLGLPSIFFLPLAYLFPFLLTYFWLFILFSVGWAITWIIVIWYMAETVTL